MISSMIEVFILALLILIPLIILARKADSRAREQAKLRHPAYINKRKRGGTE